MADYAQLVARLQTLAEEVKMGDADPQELHATINEITAAAGKLLIGRQHDAAIELLQRALDFCPDDPELRHTAALAHAGKGELALGSADRLRATPSRAGLALLEAHFDQATQLDPNVPDPHWDLAVLKARFSGEFEAAARHLAAARQLGYTHPRMPQLAVMIQQGVAGGRRPPSDLVIDAETELRQLIWTLVTWPDLPLEGAPADLAAEAVFSSDPVFDRYCSRALQLVRDAKLDVTSFERVRQDTAILQGDAAEYAADLLRVTAAEFGDVDVLARATNAHLRILAESSFALRARVAEGAQWLRRARRAASRGVQIAESAGVPIDPDIHADLLLALGQTYAHPSNYDLPVTTRYYLQALDFKRTAGNVSDVKRLEQLLRQIIDHEVKQVFAALSGFGGIGASLIDLEAGYEAAKRLADDEFTGFAGSALAETYSAVRQPANAERVLREVLALPAISEKQQISARFQLASALSESGRAGAALEIQDDLLAHADRVFGVIEPATFWTNLGNSRRETGKLEAAREAFKKALDAVVPAGKNANLASKGQITALLGQLEFLLGRPRQGARLFSTADKLFSNVPSTPALEFHGLAAKAYFDAGLRKPSQRHWKQARHLLQWHLTRGPSLPVWESMLQRWSPLDEFEVESAVQARSRETRRSALITAERAKGRLMAWLRNFRAPKGAVAALDEERQKDALGKVEQWVATGNGRHVLSLFATGRGLAVFSLAAKGATVGSWIKEFSYDEFRTDYFEPWEAAISDGVGGDHQAWQFASAVTELLLDRIGEWLWRSCPDLLKGGEELVIIPHRLFRSVPLAHCRLPRGQRLSDLFQRVTIAPALSDLAQSIEKPRLLGSKARITALTDPDGTLPFARLEGFYAAGPDHTKVADAATAEKLREALSAPGIVLVSSHGDFREDNPWNSSILASDMPVALGQLIGESLAATADLVVLGVCEAGKTRRSVSDEPLGFPSVLVQGGVATAVAPMWQVDDFASLMFMTHLFDCLREQMSPARAVALTARWMRQLRPEEALGYLDGIWQKLGRMNNPAIDEALADTRTLVGASRTWLEQLPPKRPAFTSPLDWAAFQVVAGPL
jgi:CHAT domain-containing protein/tetratricopeptide (TPR) repeat protein